MTGWWLIIEYVNVLLPHLSSGSRHVVTCLTCHVSTCSMIKNNQPSATVVSAGSDESYQLLPYLTLITWWTRGTWPYTDNIISTTLHCLTGINVATLFTIHFNLEIDPNREEIWNMMLWLGYQETLFSKDLKIPVLIVSCLISIDHINPSFHPVPVSTLSWVLVSMPGLWPALSSAQHWSGVVTELRCWQ